MDITTKKGRRGRKDIDRIIVEKGRRGDFSPLQPDHYHSFYEIFYLWSGSCRFLLKDTVYQMEAGDLVFIAPGELHHSLYSAGEICEIVMIYFKEEYLHLSDRSADSLTSISGQGLQLHSFMGSVPTVYREYLHSLLTRMLTENSRFDEYSEHFERCYLEELLLMLMRYSVMNEKEPDLLNSRDADILLATRYIYNNFRKPLTLEEVSSVASLSPTYFSKKFKLITGMGFKEYLTMYGSNTPRRRFLPPTVPSRILLWNTASTTATILRTCSKKFTESLLGNIGKILIDARSTVRLPQGIFSRSPLPLHAELLPPLRSSVNNLTPSGTGKDP